MSDLEVTKIVLDKYKIRYHELEKGEYTYIQPYDIGDGYKQLYVQGFGLYPLTESGQLNNFIEFLNGKIVSY